MPEISANSSLSGAPIIPAGGTSGYRVRLATTGADLKAAQRLRFTVFNLELREGLDSAYASGRDEDRFDPHCDHLLVEDVATGDVVGTYRLQTGQLAAVNLGYYSAQEFDFAPYEPIRCELVELGRACVHRAHRRMSVVNLLWRGIVRYAVDRKARYLIGCSSLTSQSAGAGWALYCRLREEHLAPERFRTTPLPEFALPDPEGPTPAEPAPRLLRAYLSLGAKVCGPPAIDREFKTIDFLTLLDLQALPSAASHHFLS
jgi:putative hemolysin